MSIRKCQPEQTGTVLWQIEVHMANEEDGSANVQGNGRPEPVDLSKG